MFRVTEELTLFTVSATQNVAAFRLRSYAKMMIWIYHKTLSHILSCQMELFIPTYPGFKYEIDETRKEKYKKSIFPNNKQNPAWVVLTKSLGRDNHAGRIGGNRTQKGLRTFFGGDVYRLCGMLVRASRPMISWGRNPAFVLTPGLCVRPCTSRPNKPIICAKKNHTFCVSFGTCKRAI